MRRTAAAALASLLALLVGTAAVALAPEPGAPDAGVSPVEAIVAPDASTGEAPSPPPDPVEPAAPAPSQVGVRSGRLEDLPAPAPAPVQVRVGPGTIDAPVVPIGVEADGAVAVPDDVDVAGWYRFGPTPGSPGSAVLTAHVDSAAQGAGAFFPLRDVALGTEVVVTFADGTEARFAVAGRRSYPKSSLPVEELFARAGEPVLTLITCGGAFDPATRSYEENLVVVATPVGPADGA